MTRYLLASFLSVLVVLNPVLVRATLCPSNSDSHCAVYIEKGGIVPFSGQLLTAELATDLGIRIESCVAKAELSLDLLRKKMQVEVDYQKTLLSNAKTTYSMELNALTADRDRWKEAAHVPFYERPWFVAMVTTLVIGTVVIGSSYIIGLTID